MRIGLVQCDANPGNLPANLARIASFAAQGADAGCSLLLFPELSDLGYDLRIVAEQGPHAWPRTRDTLANLAARHGICLVCGVCLAENSDIANALGVWGPSGDMLAVYRKIHLFRTSEVDEGAVFRAGDQPVQFAHDGVRFGLAVCYDLRFPELFRLYAQARCHAVLIAAAWPRARIGIWQTLIQARAMENQCLALGANRVGATPFPFGGASLCAQPDGTVMQAKATGEVLLHDVLDLNQLAATRAAIDSWNHRRTDVYQLDLRASCPNALTS